MPPSMMPASNTMLRTAPYMPYMANTSAAQQPPIQHSANFQAVGKQSKAIKIVNPETMKEVDFSNLKSMSPSSHSPSKSTTGQTVETSVESKDKEVCYIARGLLSYRIAGNIRTKNFCTSAAISISVILFSKSVNFEVLIHHVL